MKQDHSAALQVEIIQEGSVQDQSLLLLALVALATMLWYGFCLANS